MERVEDVGGVFIDLSALSADMATTGPLCVLAETPYIYSKCFGPHLCVHACALVAAAWCKVKACSLSTYTYRDGAFQQARREGGMLNKLCIY